MTDAEAAVITRKAFASFPDDETARAYLEGRLWPDGVVCPECSSKERITPLRRYGYYRCRACPAANTGPARPNRRVADFDFTVCTGTIFERSHVPLHKWVCAMYLLVSAKDSITSVQLAEQIQVSQRSAWFMLHRLREACGSDEGTSHLRGKIKLGLGLALKHGVKKIYQQCSEKHLSRYVDEFAFRHHIVRTADQQVEHLVRLGAGSRITYRELTA